ncbi:MAG: TFIIB-type zinc finger domain-containing protein [Spirochaetes bacterium]|nr:TFIIB-type zinc finger domain-containing protein [Spirochaetota bacterium]
MKDIKPLLCRQCGSHDMRLQEGKYVCHYCGTIHYDSGARRITGSVAAYIKKNKIIAVISAMAFFLVIAGYAMFVVTGPGSPEGHNGNRSDVPVEKSGEPAEAGQDAIEPEKKVSAEFTGISPLPDSIGNIYFVGIYANTGETPVLPKAEIALHNAKGEKVAVGTGYGIRGYLLPGEKIPISVLIQRAPAYSSVKSIGAAEAPSYYQQRPKLSFSRLKMSSPAHRYDYYRASGMVKNASGKNAQYVQVAVTAYDDSGRIIGYTTGFLGQTVLGNGEDAPFSVEFHIMKGKPARFAVEYSASVYKPRNK